MKSTGRVLGALAIAASAAMAGCEHTNATTGSTTPTSNSDVDLTAWEGTAEYPNGQTTVSGYAIMDSSYAQLKLTSTNPVKGEIRYFHGTSSDGAAHSKHGYDAQPTPYCTGTWTETQRLPNSETTGAEERIVHEHITSGNCQDSDWLSAVT